MKKFLISMLALFFVFATVHAQTDSSASGSMSTGTHKMKTKSSSSTSKSGHHKMHHKGTASTHKTKTKTTGGAATGTSQKPVAATNAAPATSNTATAKITKAKGAHYAVNSNGKKSYVKSPRTTSSK